MVLGQSGIPLDASEAAQLNFSRYLWDTGSEFAQLVAEVDINRRARVFYPVAGAGPDHPLDGIAQHRAGVPSGSGAHGLRLGELRFDWQDSGNDPSSPQYSNTRYYLGDGLGTRIIFTCI